MKLISWNTAHRTSQQHHQAEALVGRSPDIICLQEVTPNTAEFFQSELANHDYRFVTTSFDGRMPNADDKRNRHLGVMTISRYDMSTIDQFEIPWKEKSLSISVNLPSGSTEIHNIYVPPGSSNGWIKIETLEGVYRGLARESSRPRILCGDFNTPQRELPDGTVVTWGQRIRPDGTIRTMSRRFGGDGARWDKGERNILTGLAEYDLPDVYRALNGYEVEDQSWLLRNRGREFPRRFDHVFASTRLTAVECGYLHDWQPAGMSDHAPIEVRFDL